MKVLVVLVLAVFTGCNAGLLYADEPTPNLDMLIETFWDKIVIASQLAEDTSEKFRQTKIGQDVIAHLEQGVNAGSEFADTVFENIPTEVKTMVNKAHGAGTDLLSKVNWTKVENHVESMGERLEPVLETVAGKLVQKTQLAQDMASPFVTKLKKKLDPLVKVAQLRVDTLYDTFVKTR